MNYDVLNVSDDVLRKLGKYTRDEKFNPDDVKRASCAAAGLCAWVLNVERIAIKSRGLSPQR
jgi:dynein heavy chain, axonemal